jgi:dipeptidyl aminopeptidase/acylaminoacyl peptidase
MSDVRTILKRGVGGAAPPPDGFQRMLRRRDRKRRNQRIRAGALGLLIAAAAAAVILQVTGSDPVPADLIPAPELSPSPTTPEDVERLADLGIGTYFVNVRTGEAVPMASSITSIPGAGNYDVSPDGTMVLFDNQGALYGPASDGPVEPRLLQLFVANIDGSDVRQLTDEPFGASLGSWSPDGTKVVYVGAGRGHIGSPSSSPSWMSRPGRRRG